MRTDTELPFQGSSFVTGGELSGNHIRNDKYEAGISGLYCILILQGHDVSQCFDAHFVSFIGSLFTAILRP